MAAGWLFSMWDPAQLGQPSLFPPLIPYFGFFGLARLAGLNLGISQHLYAWLAAFFGALVVAALSRESAPRPQWRSTAWLLGGCVYLLAPSAIFLPPGWWAAIGIPLMILAAKRAITARSLSATARWGILGACGNLLLLNNFPNYELQAVLLAWVVVSTTVMMLGLRRAAVQGMLARTILYWSVAVGLLAPLLAAMVWMLLPSYFASVRITSALVGAGKTYGDYGHTTVGAVVTLMSYYPYAWQDGAVRMLSVALPLCAFFGAVRYWRNAWIRGVAAATVLAIAITIGPNPPIAPLYQWFMGHIPGALAFRTVGEVHLFVAIGYAMLAPVGVLELVRLTGRYVFRGTWFRRYARYGIALLFIGLLAFVGKPLLDGQPFRTPVSPSTQPRVIPPIYRRVGEYLSSHAGGTLIYPDQGYTEEPLENGMYFGPSLTTFAFPRNVLYSGTGAYGSPAPPEVRSLYSLINDAILAPPALLIGGNEPPTAVVDAAQGDKVLREGAIFRVIPAVGRTHDAVVIHSHLPRGLRPKHENLIVQLGGSSVADARISVAGRVVGTVPKPGRELTVPFRIPSLPRSRRLLVKIAFNVVNGDPRAVDGAYISILRIGFVRRIPKALMVNLRRRGVQYLFIDGASDDPRVPLFDLAIAGDRSVSTIMGDSHGRRLLLIRGASYAAYTLRSRGLVPVIARPQFQFGRMRIAFDASDPRALVLKQNYSPLWHYSVSVDGVPPRATSAYEWNGWGTLVILPPGHNYVVRGFFAPQFLLDLQYVIFGAVLLLAGFWAGVRMLKLFACV